MATSLQQLPTEIQCSIIRLLDPIGLISISQASSHFRSLVSPQKRHFAERLLELELLAEHGGPCPAFRARDNHISPDPLDPEWESIRWACTSCLRLLPHIHFDNHSILRLRYRKPGARTPGSPHAVTSWEPSGRRLPRRPKRDNGGLALDEKRQRLRYSICVSRGRGSAPRTELPMAHSLATLLSCGMTGLGHMTQEDLDALTPEEKLQILDENALAIEREQCGTMRHLRMCNECRYQHGDLRPQLHGRGRRWKASTMPILPSRRTSTFGTFVDRWFPNVSSALEHKRPGYNAPVYWVFMHWMRRDDATPREIRGRVARERRLAVYMARCPGCSRWKEVRDFRMSKDRSYPHWKPNVATGYRLSETTRAGWAEAEAALDAHRCNACFVKERGREELARELREWFEGLAACELMWISGAMYGSAPWQHDLFGRFTWDQRGDQRGGVPPEYVREMRWIVKHTTVPYPHTYALGPPGESFTVAWIGHAGVAALRLRLAQWKDLWERMKLRGDTSWAGMDLDEWYEDYVSDFDEAEEHWRWLMGAWAEVQERPMVLVEWALGESAEE